MKEHVRQFDFRAPRKEAQKLNQTPSPIANVFDMPGWTTDLEGATQFASVNSRRTVVFVRRNAEAASEKVVTILNGKQGERAVGDSEKVALDISVTPSLVARLGVRETPALVILDSSGKPVASKSGPMTKADVLAALGG